MATEYITNRNAIRFYIEPSCDFGDDGRIVKANGVYAGIIDGKSELRGVWFESREAAIVAISNYGG